MSDTPDKHADLAHQLFGSPVLLHESVDGMPQRRIGPVLLLERCFKYFNVDITQAFDLFGRQAFVHQGLLHLGDFGRLHPAD